MKDSHKQPIIWQRAILTALVILSVVVIVAWLGLPKTPNEIEVPIHPRLEAKRKKSLKAAFSPYQAVLQKAPSLTLYSLEGTEKPAGVGMFHGFLILGQTSVRGKQKEELLKELDVGVADTTAHPVNCFEPHHGLRAQFDGKILDLVICFKCTQFQIFNPQQQGNYWTIGKAPELLMNKFLRDSGVPFDPTYKH